MAETKSCSEQGGVEAVQDVNNREKCGLGCALQVVVTDLRRQAAISCTKHACPSAACSASLG